MADAIGLGLLGLLIVAVAVLVVKDAHQEKALRALERVIMDREKAGRA